MNAACSVPIFVPEKSGGLVLFELSTVRYAS